MAGEASPRKSFTKSVSSLFRSKKKKDKDKADADSNRAASEREDPGPDAPVAAPVERPSTAPTKTAEPKYSNNYAAEATPAAPTPAVVEPTPEPVPPVPKADEPVAAPVPDEAVAAPGTDEPVAAPEPALQPPPLADVPAGPTAEEQGGATDSPLAPGWEEVEAEDGRVYYWNEDTDSTTWEKPASRRGSMDTSSRSGSAAAAYLQATAPEVEPQPDTASGPTLADRQRAFESGSAYQTAAPSTGAKRGTANQEKVKALQKAGIQDDPNKPVSAGNSQHKLAMASLERKKERIESAGSMGKGTTQMSDALKGLAAAQERPTGPSQHQQAMERLSRTSEQKSGDAGAYSGRPKPQIVNSTLDDEVGGNQMQQAKAALFQKNQQEERRSTGSMKEEAMRKLNGKGVVSTKEAFQTKSKSGTQHNAAMAAFSQIDGTDMTTGGPKKSQLRSGPASGKPMTLNKGVGKDGSQTQRAAAMAAFQTQGKEV